jgi:hypothetical protein
MFYPPQYTPQAIEKNRVPQPGFFLPKFAFAVHIFLPPAHTNAGGGRIEQ